MSFNRNINLLLFLHFATFAIFNLDANAGVIDNVNLDDNCPKDVVIHEFRISDCTRLPCNIRRQKRYWIDADITVLRNVTNPVLKCSSVYLGKPVDLPGHGGCDNLLKGSCPLVVGEQYTMGTNFKVPYYVPPMLYTVYCSLVDDDEKNMICGWGKSHVT